jgi:acetyltransferase-like isoleucine patch superfamily enzyme
VKFNISPTMLIKKMWDDLKSEIAERIIFNSFQKEYPTCKFYGSIHIDNNSILGKYNAIFNNVSITYSEIGDHTFIQKDSSINRSKIGKFCSIAQGATIGLGQHPTDYVSTHPAFYSITQPIVKTFSEKDTFEPFKRTILGHDVWIGHNTLIMDGVEVGTGAVIAAGSVVTKNIEAYEIVGGVPAKTIRFRFNDKIRERLLLTEWWNLTDDLLANKHYLFSDPEKFLNSFDSYSGQLPKKDLRD